MALDDLPGTLVVPTRDAIATAFRRDYGIVSPGSDTSDGTQPDVLAKTVATTLLPVYSDAVLIANGINEDAATGARLDKVGARYGILRPVAVGASGYVTVSAAAGGGTIQLGDEIKNRQTGKRYQAAETKSLVDGGSIRVSGIDTGPATNLLVGTTLQWSAPRPGIGQTATVGTGGLIGGADVANDASYLAIIREARRNPATADNDAAIQKIVTATPGLAIQQVFTYPCVFGPGTSAFCFTLSVPASSGSLARIPNAAQVTAALSWMTGQLPGDDSYFAMAMVSAQRQVAYRVTWDPAAPGWKDSSPWPTYQAFGLGAGNAGAVIVNSVTSPTSFVIGTDNGDYTAITQPQVGQTIAFWDRTALVHRRKLITAVTGTGPWTVTTDTTGVSGSDTSYQPTSGQRAMPWSDSLADLAAPILTYFNNIGPGELFASFSADGRRQRRAPKPPKKYPQFVSADAIVPVISLNSVQSATLMEGTTPPAIGIPGVFVYLVTLDQIAAFP